MKKNLLSVTVLSLVAFVMISCGTSSTTVNDTIVAKTDKVIDMMNSIIDAIDADEYETALTSLDELGVYVNESKEIISKMENKSGEQFIRVAVEYLDLYTQGIVDTKEAVSIFQTAENNTQMRKANDLYNNFTDIAMTKYRELQNVQSEFANANGITLR